MVKCKMPNEVISRCIPPPDNKSLEIHAFRKLWFILGNSLLYSFLLMTQMLTQGTRGFFTLSGRAIYIYTCMYICLRMNYILRVMVIYRAVCMHIYIQQTYFSSSIIAQERSLARFFPLKKKWYLAVQGVGNHILARNPKC